MQANHGWLEGTSPMAKRAGIKAERVRARVHQLSKTNTRGAWRNPMPWKFASYKKKVDSMNRTIAIAILRREAELAFLTNSWLSW
jgi:hypothetical protein